MKTNEKCKVKNEKVKILQFAICILQFAIFLPGCASFQVGGEIQAGRFALITEKPDLALAHFQRAADLDPNYSLDFSPFREGVWTYVGRAQYGAGKIPEARKSLEQALSRYNNDYLARLYLGLSLARDGDRQRGLKQIEAGLKGLSDWLDYMEQYHLDGRFWDPNREIRSEIQRNLTVASAREPDLKTLIANAEWLGKRMEEEIDKARHDEVADRMRPGDNTEP